MRINGAGSERSRSVITISANRDAVARLFCFPFAGGGASVFRKWAGHFGDDIEVRAIQMPGRECRMPETPLTDIADVVRMLATDIAPLLDRPYAFFGHSMGSLVSYSLARELRAAGAPMPMHMFVSGRRAPHLPRERRALHDLPRADLLEELGRLEGTPAAVLENEELLELFLPLLRADFKINETYAYAPAAPLPCGATVMGGLSDVAASRAQLEAWREHFDGKVDVSMFPGGHFFIDDARAQIADRICARMAQSLRSVRQAVAC